MKLKKNEISLCHNCNEVKRINNIKRMLCESCYVDWYKNTPHRKKANRERMARNRKNDPARFIEYQLKSVTKRKGIQYELNQQWIREKLEAGHCEVSGLPFVIKQYKQGENGVRSFYAPSVDRIDNALGYIPSNCRMIVWGYNLAKNNYTEREVINLSLSLILNSVSRTIQDDLKDLLPPYLISALPDKAIHKIN